MGTITIKDPTARPTEKQEAFLGKLLKEKSHRDAEIFRIRLVTGTFNRKQISDAIDVLMMAPTAKAPAPVPAPAPMTEKVFYHHPHQVDTGAKIAAAEPVQTKPEYGYYQDASGVIWHFDQFKSKWSKQERTYRLITTYGGKPKWIYSGGVSKAYAVLKGLTPLTLAQASKIGKLHGYCIRCSRLLSDPVSVANGIGPVCAKYWGSGLV